MKKKLTIILIVVMIIGMIIGINNVYSANNIISKESESKIIELKQNSLKSIADYKEEYGSAAYGITAYILHYVRIYSIPFCFLGIVIGCVKQYVIGIRKMDNAEKGLALVSIFVTLLIIGQILPLAFAVFVKFGRE